LVRIIGQLSASVARISSRQGFPGALASASIPVIVQSFGAPARQSRHGPRASDPAKRRESLSAALLTEFSGDNKTGDAMFD
jgi:hypothetical protein